MSQNFAAQSQLPKKMPEEVTFSLNLSGGMSRSYRRIRIENGLLEFEELQNNGKNRQKWSANISSEDSKKLYQIFVKNRFDQIKNDKREGIVFDAGSENISISVDNLKSFNISYGKNSPLSGENLRRYKEVHKAIYEIVERYQKVGETSDKNLTLDEAEKFIQGKWRVTGENGGHAWFLEWTFDHGSFKQLGYPPIVQAGKYKLISLNNNKITVELYDQKGTFGEETRAIEIILDKESDQLSILGTKGFSRVF